MWTYTATLFGYNTVVSHACAATHKNEQSLLEIYEQVIFKVKNHNDYDNYEPSHDAFG